MAAIVLVSAGLFLRFAGAVVRVEDHHWAMRLSGWLSCMVGMWLLASAAGAWSPLWIALALAAAGSAIHLGSRSAWTFVAFDVAAIVVFSLVALPRLDNVTLLLVAAGAGCAGYFMDRAAILLHWKLRLGIHAVQCLGIVTAVAAFVQVAPTMPVFAWHAASPAAWLHIAVAPTPQVRRTELVGGVVAWIERPRKNGPAPGAVFFHGAHRDGAHQPAAKVVRRALLDAGFVVISLDHPGFGASPLPNEDHVEAWDPLPAKEEALRLAREAADDRPVIVVGHSMGCLDVMRALAVHTDIDAALLFGGAVNVPRPDDEEWAERFYVDRQITEPMEPELITEIRKRLYDAHVIASALPDDLPPVLFVHFGIEHENVVIGRDHLAAMFPNELTHWHFHGATHYFNAWRRGGVLVGDRRVASRLADRLRELREELEGGEVESQLEE